MLHTSFHVRVRPVGDNRADSCDSRYWGPIKGSSIIGKVVLVWWHDNHPDLHWF